MCFIAGVVQSTCIARWVLVKVVEQGWTGVRHNTRRVFYWSISRPSIPIVSQMIMAYYLGGQEHAPRYIKHDTLHRKSGKMALKVMNVWLLKLSTGLAPIIRGWRSIPPVYSSIRRISAWGRCRGFENIWATASKGKTEQSHKFGIVSTVGRKCTL